MEPVVTARYAGHTMVAFDTAKVERALRGALGDEVAREVTEALAEGLSEHAATKSDVDHLEETLRGELRGAEQRITIRLGAWTLAVATLATAVILWAR